MIEVKVTANEDPAMRGNGATAKVELGEVIEKEVEVTEEKTMKIQNEKTMKTESIMYL